MIDNQDAIDKLNQTGGKAEETTGKFGKIASAAGVVGGAVVAGASAAVGGLVAMTTKVTDTTSAIKDSADRAGMSAEEYQKWAYAASMCGMEADTLESAMIKQQKAFADAKTGSKSMSDAYAKLGVDINSIGSSSEAFDQTMAALSQMEDATQRDAIANDLFGKSYAELTPLLNEGAAGMDALKQQAVDMGTVMSNDAVAAGENLGDSIDSLKQAGMGLFNSLGTSLVPIIQNVVDLIIQNLPTIQEMFAQIAPALGEFMSQLLPVLVDLGQQLLPVIMQIIMALLPIIMELMPLFTTIITALLPPIVELLNLLIPPLLDLLNVIIPPLTEVIKWLADSLGKYLTAAITNLTPVIDGITTALKGVIDFVTGVFTGNWKKAWQGVQDIFSGIFGALVGYVKAPINTVIDLINRFFANMGSLKIPDWVPEIGGTEFSLPQIPRLKVGMDYVPYDNFPAILHKGERVMTAEENANYGAIDYDRLSAAMRRGMNGSGIYLDGRTVGRWMADNA